MTILKDMAKALEMESGEMEEFFEEGFQSMRMNCYPPCPEAEKVIGLTPHSYAVGLTILLQINEVEGLQIKKDGKWVPTKPLPNAFIINIGHVLEVITNGAYRSIAYRSITHRATINSERERLPVATFYNPKYEGEIGSARNLISQQKPALFKRLGG
ncbi:hypothetical protein SLE2022_312780 [Rubroshorea leprosula]